MPSPLISHYTHDADNRLLTAPTTSFAYDDNGNLITKTVGSNVTGYAWNYDNMLTQYSTNGNTYTYTYDGLGNRVARVANSVETRYVGDGLAETDSSGNITAYYVYGLGLISKITPSGQAYYYHYDGIGSTIAITDSSGVIVNKYAYDAFGKVIEQDEQISNPFRYVGQYGVMDEGNGLFYMRARYYDPEVGRFVNKDPIGFEGGDVNLYAYVGNNPVNYNDPEGKWWPVDIIRSWYYVYKVQNAIDRCRSKYMSECKTDEDEIKFLEGAGSTGYDAYIWNCVIKETGDPRIWGKVPRYGIKGTFPHGPYRPSAPMPKGG